METPDIDESTQYGPTFVFLNLLDENNNHIELVPIIDVMQTVLVPFSVFVINHDLLVMYAVVFKSSVITLKNLAFKIKTNPIYAISLSVN